MAKTKGVYKRGNIWWIRYAGLDGKTVFESSGSEKKTVAESLYRKRKAEVDSGKQPEIKKIANHTFHELAEEYLLWCERQRSFRSKAGFIKQLKDAFGNLPLRQFNTRLLEQFQTERLQKGEKRVKAGQNEWAYPPNKPATVNRLIATLKHMFTKAVQWDMVEETILKRIKQVKLIEENNRRLRFLSVDECNSLIDQCEGITRAIVITALHTGMRKGEILSLRRDNVDQKHRFILVDKTKNGERREIRISDTLRFTLQGLPTRLDVPYVFFNPDTGKPFKDVSRSFKTALKRAGIRDFHFHDLRHTFASHLVMSRADITTVKELLGHKTLTMTLRYAHLAPSHKVKAIDTLDRVLNGIPTVQELYNSADGQ